MTASVNRWKITIEYHGAPFHGWQYQPDVPTVQEAIQTAIFKFCQQNIIIQGAGRTDAGVHARGQVAHFDLDYPRGIDEYAMARAINAHLRPAPISIINAQIVRDDFHARHSAVNKLYIYKMMNRRGFLAIDQGQYFYVNKPLDVNAMHDAAQILVGQHDFSTFRDGQCQAQSPVRTLDRLDVSARKVDEYGGQEVFIHAEARSFLHHQMRNITGTLVLVGTGKWRVDDVKTALSARDRRAGGPTAPADGLYLMRIDYP